MINLKHKKDNKHTQQHYIFNDSYFVDLREILPDVLCSVEKDKQLELEL